jgi:flagellin
MITVSGGISRVIQRHLESAQAGQKRSFERISSSLRINRAADDAAGLAVSERQDTVARSKRAAIRNISEGMDALSTAEGGLNAISEMLSRMRELAVQSASEVLADDERQFIQTEYGQLMKEITSTARKTDWNGRNLLAFDPIDVGILVDSSASMDKNEIPNVKAAIKAFRDTFLNNKLDVSIGLAEVNRSRDTTDGTHQLADVGSGDFDAEIDALTTIGGQVDPYSALLNTSGIADVGGTEEPDKFSWREDAKNKVLVYVTDTNREIDLIPGAETQATVADSLAAEGFEVHTINRLAHNPTFSDITDKTGGSTWDIGDSTGDNVAASLTAIANALTEEIGETGRVIQVSHGDTEASRIELGIPFNATAYGLKIDESAVATRDEALAALSTLDEALTLTNEMRSQIGSYTNRLDVALNLETTAVENLEMSRSRIRDADLAFETAELAKYQIIGSAASSLLSTAARVQRDAVMKLIG